MTLMMGLVFVSSRLLMVRRFGFWEEISIDIPASLRPFFPFSFHSSLIQYNTIQYLFKRQSSDPVRIHRPSYT